MEEARKLVTIRTVSEVKEIPGADFIEIIVIDGWQCVSKKGELKVNDLCIFAEIDSFLPIKPQFEFLRKTSYKCFASGVQGFRLKTVKFKGQISQGLAIPLSAVKLPKKWFGTYKVGDEVTKQLGVIKYDAEEFRDIPKNNGNRYLWRLKLLIRKIKKPFQKKLSGSFPSFIPKTDEERIQNLVRYLPEWQGRLFEETEKLDGSSTTYFFNKGEFGICSRNFRLLNGIGPFGNVQWHVAELLQLAEKLKALGQNIAIQGEMIGTKIQGNKYKLVSEHRFYVFRIWMIDEKAWASPAIRRQLTESLGLLHVPVPNESTPCPLNLEDCLKRVEGISTLGGTEREGHVFKSCDGGPHISFKVINNKFLLKHED